MSTVLVYLQPTVRMDLSSGLARLLAEAAPAGLVAAYLFDSHAEDSQHCGQSTRIWLFGLRVDDGRCGGDVALIVGWATCANRYSPKMMIEWATPKSKSELLGEPPPRPVAVKATSYRL